MNTYRYIKNAIITSAFGSLLLVGSVLNASAQNVDQQYRQWQRAQAEAAQRQQEYLMTRSMRDYREWQMAQARAQREYNDYQRASMYGNNRGRWNDRNDSWANNGYNNNVYSNGRYRIYANGSYYETDSRGAELLKQAVRNGYTQGYRQGQIDRNYRRGYNYNGNTYYQSGNYGYQSYVGRDQYQYFFQQGFQRGYEDGYNSTSRYGYRSGNGFNILGSILNTIINLSNDR